jgi:hypothetical protein
MDETNNIRTDRSFENGGQSDSVDDRSVLTNDGNSGTRGLSE